MSEDLKVKTEKKKVEPSAIIDQWFQETFPNTTEIAGNTPVWNFMMKAVEDLKKRLAKED